MSTSLLNCEVLLSKRIGDYYSSTTTSAGNSSGTTIVDTNLYAYPDNWLQSQSHLMWDMITSGTYDEEERRILSKNNDTLTVLAHGGQIDSGVTYRIHRLYSPTDKKNALIYACKSAFPFIHERIEDKSLVSGDWLKIDNLNLADVPHSVSYETGDYTNDWIQIKGIEYNDGYMVLPSYVPVGRRLKVDGIGYLDFLSSGVSSTSWDATVDIDSPQTEILVTYAAIYLLENSILPQQDTGSSELILQALNLWEKKRLDSLRYKMPIPQWTVNQWMFT